MRLWDTGSVVFKVSFAIFVPGPTTPGIEVITTPDVAHHKLRRKYYGTCGAVSH